jgi:hypothetical protein
MVFDVDHGSDHKGGIGEEALVMNCRVGRMGEEARVVYINVIFWCLFGGTDKITKSLVNTNILHYC